MKVMRKRNRTFTSVPRSINASNEKETVSKNPKVNYVNNDLPFYYTSVKHTKADKKPSNLKISYMDLAEIDRLYPKTSHAISKKSMLEALLRAGMEAEDIAKHTDTSQESVTYVVKAYGMASRLRGTVY